MSTNTNSRSYRYGVFVYDPDGDSGDGVIVGPFCDADAADAKADTIRNVADARYEGRVECIVVPIEPSRISARSVLEKVLWESDATVLAPLLR